MLGWLYRVIIGHFDKCSHKWKTIEEYSLCDHRDHNIKFMGYILRCDSCGNIKKEEIRLC